jgi:hypothetical protein
LFDLGTFHSLQAFLEYKMNDSFLKHLSTLTPLQISRLYNMTEEFAASFVQRCRLMSTAPQNSDDRHQKDLWLKACLILEACIKGVGPFVSKVMEHLHIRVAENAKQDIVRDLGACENEDWDCSTCGEAADARFTENGPVALAICSMDSNGIADCGTAHDMKPLTLKPCFLRNIPAGCFSDSDDISPTLPVLICSDKPNCSTFTLLHGLKPTPSKPYLTPFFVVSCEPDKPALKFHAILCCSRRGCTAQLAKSLPLQQTQAHGELSFGFWSLTTTNPKKTQTLNPGISTVNSQHETCRPQGASEECSPASCSSEFFEIKHGFKKSDILQFEAVKDNGKDHGLPPGIVEGRRYLVTDASDYSFNICGPIISPVLPWTSELLSPDEAPLVVIRRSPIGR